MGEAGFEPATSCVLDKHSGQAELLAHVIKEKLRDKGSNLGLHVQSVASCRLDVVPKHVGSSGPPWRLSAVEAAQSKEATDEASP